MKSRLCSGILALTFLVFLSHGLVSAQPPSDNLSRAAFRGTKGLPIFDDDLRLIIFSLTTSWIPGADRKGTFRYRLSVSPSIHSAIEMAKEPSPPQGWAVPNLISRLHDCTYTLRLMDSGAFVLQRVPVVFQTTVDDEGIAIGMDSNDYFAMQLAQYRSFLSAKREESWDVVWHCAR